MGLHDISLRVEAPLQDLETVEALVKRIVQPLAPRATVQVAEFRTGGFFEQMETPDGPMTFMHCGDAVDGQFIVYIDRITMHETEIRRSLGQILIVYDDNFYSKPEISPNIGNDDASDEWLDELQDWR